MQKLAALAVTLSFTTEPINPQDENGTSRILFKFLSRHTNGTERLSFHLWNICIITVLAILNISCVALFILSNHSKMTKRKENLLSTFYRCCLFEACSTVLLLIVYLVHYKAIKFYKKINSINRNLSNLNKWLLTFKQWLNWN